MTRDEFSKLLDEIQSQERQAVADGQKEYAHEDSNNVFANFNAAADELGGTNINDLMHLALKHWRGICAYAKGHRSQREDIRGRIKDLRCYLALLWGMIEEEDTKTKLDIEYTLSTKCRVSDCNNPIVHGQTECIVHLKSGWQPCNDPSCKGLLSR